MVSKSKVRIVVDEECVIVERLNAIAQAEGIDRADVLRRAIRLLLLSAPKLPTSGTIPTPQSDSSH